MIFWSWMLENYDIETDQCQRSECVARLLSDRSAHYWNIFFVKCWSMNEREKRPLHFHYHPRSLRSPDPYPAHQFTGLFKTSLLYYSNQTFACLSSSAIPYLCQEEELGRCWSPPLTLVVLLEHSSFPSLRPNRAFFAQFGYPLKLAHAQLPQMLTRNMDAPDWGSGGIHTLGWGSGVVGVGPLVNRW